IPAVLAATLFVGAIPSACPDSSSVLCVFWNGCLLVLQRNSCRNPAATECRRFPERQVALSYCICGRARASERSLHEQRLLSLHPDDEREELGLARATSRGGART